MTLERGGGLPSGGIVAPRMNDLPLLAKIHVGTIVLAGTALLVVCLPFARFADPVLF